MECDISCPGKSLRVSQRKLTGSMNYLELRRKTMRAKHLANICKNDELYRTAKALRNRLNNMAAKL